MIIDASNQILGRIGTYAAKNALLGEEIIIINSEKAILSGDKKKIFQRYSHKRDMGVPAKGPFIPRRPAFFVKRTIRGMLPYKQPKGKEALKRIKCYSGIPEDIKDKPITLKGTDKNKLPFTNYATVEEICKHMGAKL